MQKKMRKHILIIQKLKSLRNSFYVLISISLFSCSTNVESVSKSDVEIIKDTTSIKSGDVLFKRMCVSCHNLAADSIFIFNKGIPFEKIKKALNDTLIHSNAHLSDDEIKAITEYLNRGPLD